MSFKAILAAAGLAIAAIGASAPAEAHQRGGYDRHYDRGYHDGWRGDRGDRRDWRDHRKWNRKHHKWRDRDRRHYGWNDRHGWNDRRGRDCWREWHHGRRVLVCNRW